MSLDFNVYVPQIDDTIIPKWIERMNQMGMKCEVHPEFSFKDHSGFLPFRVKIENPKNLDLANKEFVTGFEFHLEEFSLESALESLKPKKTFFQKILKNVQEERVVFISEEIDTRLKDCKKVMIFKWGSTDTFELRMASLSSAILSELTEGVCCYPADDIWYNNAKIVDDAYKEVIAYESSISDKDWKVHLFEGWK